MKLSIKIRYAKTKDIEKIVQLWSEFMEEHHKLYKLGIRPTQKNIKKIKKWFRKKIRSKGLIIAEHKEDLIGYILFYKSEFPLEKDYSVGYISDIFVKKQYRSLGIGVKLIKKAQKALKRKKCDTAALSVIYLNRKAIEFYKKRGYKKRFAVMYKALK